MLRMSCSGRHRCDQDGRGEDDDSVKAAAHAAVPVGCGGLCRLFWSGHCAAAPAVQSRSARVRQPGRTGDHHSAELRAVGIPGGIVLHLQVCIFVIVCALLHVWVSSLGACDRQASLRVNQASQHAIKAACSHANSVTGRHGHVLASMQAIMHIKKRMTPVIAAARPSSCSWQAEMLDVLGRHCCYNLDINLSCDGRHADPLP